ncbi:phage tail domain-containing protein [Ligilactobacillus equi]
MLKKHPKLWVKFKSDITGIEEEERDVEDIVHGLWFLGDSESPSLTNSYLSDTTNDGSTFARSQYTSTTVTAKFILKFHDFYMFRLQKHEFNSYFGRKGVYRIRTDVHKGIVRYVRVSALPDIQPSETGSYFATFDLSFENPSGLGKSLMTSANLYTYGMNAWQLGMNLPPKTDLQYTYEDLNGHVGELHNFKIYNASDIDIDPYLQGHDMKIRLRYIGSQITVWNKTTHTSVTINYDNPGGDVILIDGLIVYINSIVATNKTDYGTLMLAAKCWNEFVVTGGALEEITFDFPFLYLPS